MNNKPNPYHRHRARCLLVQALYQWQLSGNNISDVEVQFLSNEENVKKVDIDYFRELLHAIPQNLDRVQAVFEPYLDRAIQNVDPVELAILRLSCYELSQRIELPYKVIINEALELAKIYAAEESYKYINGVLDRAAKDIRSVEWDNEAAHRGS